jgi:hypothetical protein
MGWFERFFLYERYGNSGLIQILEQPVIFIPCPTPWWRALMLLKKIVSYDNFLKIISGKGVENKND